MSVVKLRKERSRFTSCAKLILEALVASLAPTEYGMTKNIFSGHVGVLRCKIPPGSPFVGLCYCSSFIPVRDSMQLGQGRFCGELSGPDCCQIQENLDSALSL
eukprot:4672486-Amphidinium_carterae.1